MKQATDAYCWTLPWVAGLSVNSIYVRTRHGYRLSDAAASWRQQAITQIRQEYIDQRRALALPAGFLAIFIDIYPPNHRTRDDDNWTKFTRDTVMLAFCRVDSLVRHSESTMWEPSETPRLVVRIESWNEEATRAK